MRVWTALLLLTIATNAHAGSKEDYALDLEKHMLRMGIDVSVRATAQTLTVQSPLMDRPAVFQLVEGPFLRNAKKQGFREVVFTDGGDHVWRYDVNLPAPLP